MRPPVPFLVLLVLSAVLAGCVGEADPAVPATDAPEYVTFEGRQYRANGWLLDEAGTVAASDVGSGSEPAIWVDRAGEYIFIGDTRGVYRSSDDGQTFQRIRPFQPNIIFSDGWDVTQDDAGNLYAAGLAEARLHVYRSTNDGSSWSLLETVPDTVGVIPDRPWIAARGDGVVALVYNDWPTLKTRCMISYDGGQTWPDQNPSAGAIIAGNLVFDGEDLYFADEGGKVWKKTPRVIAGMDTSQTCLNSGGSWKAVHNDLGSNALLQLAAEDGNVYVVYADSENDLVVAGTRDMVLDRKVVQVSPVELKSSTFGAIDIQDGRLAVAWYGSETDGDPDSSGFDGSWNVFVAVIDGFWTDAPVVQHFRLTESANHYGPICMAGLGCGVDRDLLDYFELDIGPDGDVHVAYADDASQRGVRTFYGRITP